MPVHLPNGPTSRAGSGLSRRIYAASSWLSFASRCVASLASAATCGSVNGGNLAATSAAHALRYRAESGRAEPRPERRVMRSPTGRSLISRRRAMAPARPAPDASAASPGGAGLPAVHGRPHARSAPRPIARQPSATGLRSLSKLDGGREGGRGIGGSPASHREPLTLNNSCFQAPFSLDCDEAHMNFASVSVDSVPIYNVSPAPNKLPDHAGQMGSLTMTSS